MEEIHEEPSRILQGDMPINLFSYLGLLYSVMFVFMRVSPLRAITSSIGGCFQMDIADYFHVME